ncbi:MAG: sugar kinase [Calditrichaeota bacterium]|nr:sugar kinase [Calditrichota bacterium]
MSILVVGSTALDSVETAYGKVEDALGGSAFFFGAAASHFTPVNLVGVVGEDFDLGQLDFLKAQGCDLAGIAVEKGRTFRWGGKYHKDVNKRDTLFTELNVFENFNPQIPESYRDAKYVFLANITPALQLQVLEQVHQPDLIVLDTMNLWINIAREDLMEVIRKVDIMILNDEELGDLTGEVSLFGGAQKLLSEGLKAIVVKKGQHGAVLITPSGMFLASAYPVEKVVDPTGAGDSFAGGFVGYLAANGGVSPENLRQAVIQGTVVASFSVEDFSLNRLKGLTKGDLEKRTAHFRELTRF